MERPIIGLMDYFMELPDPRIDRRKLHSLTDILCITICVVICGAQHWTEVKEFGLAKESWFRTFLSLAEHSSGDIISVDGKALRKSFDSASAKAAIHMISAFSSANGLVLGQLKINDKSNEITAIPELLRCLKFNPIALYQY